MPRFTLYVPLPAGGRPLGGCRYAELLYNGLWFSPERLALQAAIDATQKYNTGTVRLKLYKVGSEASKLATVAHSFSVLRLRTLWAALSFGSPSMIIQNT